MNTKKKASWVSIKRIGATAALMTGGLFLVAAIELILTGVTSVPGDGWFSAISDNWLVVIFKLLSGFGDGQIKTLEGVNALDVTILLLVGISLIGLFAVLRKTSKIWSLIAVVLPFLGVGIFLITRLAGRSALMAAILVISSVMLRESTFSRVTAWLGIVASVFLLAGDFSVGSSYASAIAPLFGIGYLLLIAWLFLTGIKLYQLDKSEGRMSDQK